MERRAVLAVLVQAGSAVVALIVGIPTLIYALSPLGKKRSGEDWRALGPLDDFPVGEVKKGIIQTAETSGSRQTVPQGVYVWRRPQEQETVVFSRSCTDLGCPVLWDRGSHCFLCPCHGGIFDHNGDRMAGPPDRPLYRYANRVRDDVLEIDLSSVPPMV